MAAKGGKRAGAGRPVGSTNKVRFADFVSQADKDTFVEFMLSNYMGDMRLATWVGDQLFGKASQALDVNTTGTLTLQFDNAFTSSPKTNSK